jgi:hypothetical protein
MTISVEDFTDQEKSYYRELLIELLGIEVVENAWRKRRSFFGRLKTLNRSIKKGPTVTSQSLGVDITKLYTEQVDTCVLGKSGKAQCTRLYLRKTGALIIMGHNDRITRSSG